MHKYFLITPQLFASDHDPGVTFITHGCRYLISQADPDALFLPISNIWHSAPDWKLLFDQADCLVLAGSPLYDPSDIQVYWNYDIWKHVDLARSRGIPVVDLWGYSSHPFPLPDLDTMAQTILTTHRTQRLLKIQKHFNMIITRDLCSQLIASSMRQDVSALPCCSFWAHRYFNVSSIERSFNCVTLRHRPGQEWLIEPLHALAHELSKDKPTYLVCHTRHEYWWFKKNFPDPEHLICIYDPKSLLEFYARCDKVISIRLHATIPALSLGCNVINLSVDARSQALDLYDIPSTPYTDLKQGPIDLVFHNLNDRPPPSRDYFIERFKDEIVWRLKDVS